jgi:hypothetical protein
MAIDDLMRLAWLAQRDGRPGVRDVLMTLAVAQSGPEDAIVADRCRRKLIARRPDHFFAPFRTLGRALADSRVAQALKQLRSIYPPARVEWLLLQGDARRGPYTGQHLSRATILEELVGLPLEPQRTFEPQAVAIATSVQPPAGSSPTVEDAAGSSDERPALPFASAEAGPTRTSEALDDPAALVTFYLTVLLAIAILLHCVNSSPAQDTKAA